MKELTTPKRWKTSPYRVFAAHKNKYDRTIESDSVDRTRHVFLRAYYEGGRNKVCVGIQCSLTSISPGVFPFQYLTFGIKNPSADVKLELDKLCRWAGEGGGVYVEPTDNERPSRRTQDKGRAPTTPSEAPRADVVKPIRVNEFLVRRSYGSHRNDGHSLQTVRATVCVLPKSGGDPRPIEFDAYWCPKCRKYFMGEGTYLRLKRQGYICCKVIEERDLRTRRAGDGLYDDLAAESVLHMYGYTVNQKDDLSRTERQTIISFVIENHIQTAQEIAHLLEWLVGARRNDQRMRIAVERWRDDLSFVKHYNKPTRRVRVDAIYAKL